jgi:transposase-like protein
MPRPRKNHPPNLKAKVALEALKGLKTASEIGQAFSVHPNLVAIWKKHATDGMQSLFENPREDSTKQQELESERDELYRQIGQLKVEVDWLKKKSGLVR